MNKRTFNYLYMINGSAFGYLTPLTEKEIALLNAELVWSNKELNLNIMNETIKKVRVIKKFPSPLEVGDVIFHSKDGDYYEHKGGWHISGDYVRDYIGEYFEEVKEENKINHVVQIYLNNTTLSVWVDENLKQTDRNLKNFGDITISNGRLDKSDVSWDNLDYFFDLNLDKIKEMKDELKKKNQYYDDVIDDIQRLIARGFEMGILVRE